MFGTKANARGLLTPPDLMQLAAAHERKTASTVNTMRLVTTMSCPLFTPLFATDRPLDPVSWNSELPLTKGT